LRAKLRDWKSKSLIGLYSGGGAVALTSTPPAGGGGAVGKPATSAAEAATAARDLNNMVVDGQNWRWRVQNVHVAWYVSPAYIYMTRSIQEQKEKGKKTGDGTPSSSTPRSATMQGCHQTSLFLIFFLPSEFWPITRPYYDFG
jgi:hypothetical protein